MNKPPWNDRDYHEWDRQMRSLGEPLRKSYRDDEKFPKKYSKILEFTIYFLVVIFFIDIFSTHTIHLHTLTLIAFLAFTIPSLIFLVMSIFKPFRHYLRPSLKVVTLSFFITFIVIGFLPENINISAFNQNTEKSISQRSYINSSLKFDTTVIDPEKNKWHNFFVACEYLKSFKYTDINKAEKVRVEDIYKHTWKYIGKLVYVTIDVAIAEELPPNDNTSRALNPGGPSTIILAPTKIGGVGDTIQYHYGGSFEGFEVGDTVKICGYVVGKAENTNRPGGRCYNIIIVGKYIKKISR